MCLPLSFVTFVLVFMPAVTADDGLDPELFPDSFASMMITFTVLDCRLERENVSTE